MMIHSSYRGAFSLPILFSIVVTLLICTQLHADNNGHPVGSIFGTVVNAETMEPLASVNVAVLPVSMITTTDSTGRFVIRYVPVGNYNVFFQRIGFEHIVQSDVLVRPDRITTMSTGMREKPIQSEETVVQADYFSNTDMTPLSFVSFNAEEIRRAPGSAGDVSRILMALPGTAQVADNANDLMVRGGSPVENGFFVDGIQIPNINHFPVQGGTGGPIGIINVDFLDDVSFYTGGFPVTYGNRLSSIVDMKFRDGNREAFDAQLDMGLSGFGGVIEGPLPGKKGSWFFSARRSYLDLLVKAIGTGVAPRYGDAQSKITFDIDSRNTITVLDIFSTSSIGMTHTDALDNHEEYFGTYRSYQNTAGLTWRSLWSEKGYSTTSLSYSLSTSSNHMDNTSDETDFIDNTDYQGFVNIRNMNFYEIHRTLKIEAGVDAEYSPTEYDYVLAEYRDRLGNVVPAAHLIKNLTTVQVGVFINTIWNPFERLTVTAGLRRDYFSFNDHTNFSPRLILSYRLNERLSLNASAGLFTQHLPSVLLMQNEAYKNLHDPEAIHYVLGLDYMLTADTKLTFELYEKEYRNLPLDPSDPALSLIDDGRSGSHFRNYSFIVDKGKAYTRGMELLIQKKLAKDFYGLISASLFRSRYRDYSGQWRDRLYDNRYLFSVIGGYKPNNTWEFSLRWTIAGGVPYTPFDIEQSTSANTGIIDRNRINGSRYPDYHSMNIRVDKRFFFQYSSLTLYLSILNAYGRENIDGYSWDKVENKQRTSHQWGFLPIIGFEYEL
jgi:hypothetical protein